MIALWRVLLMLVILIMVNIPLTETLRVDGSNQLGEEERIKIFANLEYFWIMECIRRGFPKQKRGSFKIKNFVQPTV